MIIKNKPEYILTYLEDSSNLKFGKAEKIFLPENENDIKEVLELCVKEKVPLTVSAAGTGTVAGRIPLDGYVISLENFNKIIKIDGIKKVATLQAGVVIENFLKEISKYELFYPPFPTERTAFIGGNVATNASGEYSFRFGSTRDYVKRVKMVLSTGEVLDISRGQFFEENNIINFGKIKVPMPSYRTPDVKCSAGYYIKNGMDAIDLLIGFEGTLGVITEVDVSLIENLPDRFILLVFFREKERIPYITKEIKKNKHSLNIYSIEYFDNNSLEFLKEKYEFILPDCCALYIEADKRYIDGWGGLLEEFNPALSVVAESHSDYQRLIEFRRQLPETVNSYFKKIGCEKIAVDAAVPEDNFFELYKYYLDVFNQHRNLKMVLFGHIGENHLHFNIFPIDESQRILAEQIYINSIKLAVALGGTGFAEHGIGKLKSKYLKYMYKELHILEMAKIKKIFDPFWILCLDNIFPRDIIKNL